MVTKNISDFFNEDYASSSVYVTSRVLSSFIDGFAFGPRKAISVLESLPKGKELKVESLASKTVDAKGYLHGSVSIANTISLMGQGFTGSNNYPLLKAEGNFGTRFTPEPAASRYIYTSLSDFYYKFFSDEDLPLLEYREFEGQKVEPKFYLPIVPTILLNPSQGIGVGYSSNLYGRRLSDVTEGIRKALSGIKVTKIPLYIKGFKGSTSFYDGNKIEVLGNYKVEKSTIIIDEIPFDFTLQQYLKILDDLEDSGVIKSYKDESDNDQFLFKVKVSQDFLSKGDDEIRKIFKLNKKLYETFNCLGPNDEILTFKDEGEILEAFVKFRLPYFQKRLDYQILSLEAEILKAKNQWRFVTGILEESLNIYKKKKLEIENILDLEKFDRIEGNFEYLMSMRIDSFEASKLENLEKKIKNAELELSKLRKLDGKKLWLSELSRLDSDIKD